MAGKYKRVYLGVGSTLVGLFLLLSSFGLIITSDGDKVCAGTLDDPCISYFSVVNPTAKSIYIYNKEEVDLDFSPSVKDYELFVKYYGKWVPMDFTMESRLSNVPSDRLYVFVFPRYSKKEFKLVGYKNSPSDSVKWGFGTGSDYMDPLWGSVGVEPMFDVGSRVVPTLNYDVLEYSGELENYSMTISNTSYVYVDTLVVVNESFNYTEQVIEWDFDIEFSKEVKGSEQLIPIKKADKKIKDLKFKKETKNNKTNEKYYDRIIKVKHGEVYHFGTTSVIINFTTSNEIVSNVVNDVFVYDNGTAYYLVASDGGFDIIYLNSSSEYENIYQNTTYAPAYQIFAKDNLLYVDDGTNFQNYSWGDWVYSNALSRENNVWFNTNVMTWTNATGWCVNTTSGLDFSFDCDNFEYTVEPTSVVTDGTNYFVGQDNGGVQIYNSTFDITKVYSKEVNTGDPVLWNTLDSLTAVQNSKIGANGVVGGTVTYQSGFFTNSAYMAQYNNYITFGDMSATVNPDTGYTAEVWWKPDYPAVGGAGTVGVPMGWQNAASNNARHLLLYRYGSDRWEWYFSTDLSDPTGLYSTSGGEYDWAAGEWVHIATAVNLSDGTQKLFVNGVEITQTGGTVITAGSVTDVSGGVTQLRMGHQASGGHGVYGEVDNLKIYDYIKTDWSDRFIENQSDATYHNILGGVDISDLDYNTNLWCAENSFGLEQIDTTLNTIVANWTNVLPSVNLTSVSSKNSDVLVGFLESGASVFEWNTCTYSTGDWSVLCSDNCAITSNVAIDSTNNITITGTGTFSTTANISGWTNLHIAGTDSSNLCRVTCSSGGCFK